MKLVCAGCGAHYQIDDAIVRGKLVRLRCKRCATILEVRGPREGSSGSRVMRLGPPSPPPRSVTEPAREDAGRAAPALAEWYLSVEGRLRGPMSPAELRQRVRRREAGPSDLVWSPGFGGWRPIAAVEEIQAALDEPAPPPRHLPPALPAARAAGGSLLRLLPSERGGPLAAPAPVVQAVAPAPAPVPQPVPAQIPAAARWPLLVALLGGISLALAVALVLVLREHERLAHPGLAAPPARRTQLHVGPPEIERQPELAPASQEAEPSSRPVSTTLPTVEVRGRRGAPPPPPTVTATPEPRESDLKTVLAAQILRHNRGSLAACDRLAERRGETLRRGSRAEFRVRVEEDGRASIQVTGQGLSAATLTCYRSVATEWKLPQIGEAYSTVFAHVH
jgi:predicted Zn finger-like uncharacterized protein